ncbi:MAG: rubredoxin-like domain-containing protein, partial [Thermodesulfobacteriota bacterium]
DESTARMLHVLADSEEVHARRIMMHLRGKIGTDVDEHLDELISTKRKDFTVQFFEVAEILHREGRETAAEAFEQFGETAKAQFELLNRRRKDGSAGDQTFFVCQVCGFIAVDAPPKNCPVCHAVESKFRKPE